MPDFKKPPSVSFDDVVKMFEEGLKKNAKDWKDKEGDYTGAGEVPFDDDHFGDDED